VPLGICHERAFTTALADAGLMTFVRYELLLMLPLFLQAVKVIRRAPRAGIELSTNVGDIFCRVAGRGTARQCLGPAGVISIGMTLTGIGLVTLPCIGASVSWTRRLRSLRRDSLPTKIPDAASHPSALDCQANGSLANA